jgi:flagellar biosynthetic protein FliO
MLSLVEAPNTMMLVLRLALSLGLVLALVGAVTWVLRRRGLLAPGGAKGATGRLEVLDRKTLNKHASLVVARVGDVAVLVGVTEQHITVLSEAPGIDAAWRAAADGEPAAALATDPAPQAEPEPGTEPATALMPPADFPADTVIDLERLLQLPSAVPATGTSATALPADTELDTEARRTGLRVDADAATATSSGMSFIEALRELTVRRS